MWSNRVPPAFAAIVAIIIAVAFTLAAEIWHQTPDRSFGRACVDSIERVYTDLQGATCEPNQTLAYMRDLSGERFIVCRCWTDDEVPEDGLQVELPELPTLLWNENDEEKNLPPKEQPKTWSL